MAVAAIEVEALNALREDGAPHALIDVREAWELEICALPGAIHIPMAEIPARIDEIGERRPIVVLCHHGVRSMTVARYLDTNGVGPVINLTGGIAAWADRVDSGMARY